MMAFPHLLTTKFHFPPVRHNLVSRPRLIEKVMDGLQVPFTLISAPAGYGKITLLSEWRAGTGRDYQATWLSLDADDNDPILFLTYLIASFRELEPGFGETALHLLQSPQSPPEKSVLTILINELEKFNEPFALVIGDYQFITAQPVHDALVFILDHQPAQMHLILLTRADPPLPLARMRARNQMQEIRAADLRFTLSETADFQKLGVENRTQAVAQARELELL